MEYNRNGEKKKENALTSQIASVRTSAVFLLSPHHWTTVTCYARLASFPHLAVWGELLMLLYNALTKVYSPFTKYDAKIRFFFESCKCFGKKSAF